MNNQEKFEQYIADINAGIDAFRADLWDTASLPELRQPVDNYAKAHQRQADRALGSEYERRYEKVHKTIREHLSSLRRPPVALQANLELIKLLKAEGLI